MLLERLLLLNYKNIEKADLTFGSNINCFIGNNGAGKTNLLSAIYYLALTKDYFNNNDINNIRNQESFFIIDGYFSKNNISERIFCAVQRDKGKVIQHNGKEYDRFSDHIGYVPLVMITPTDTMVIYQGSEERRKLLNFLISQYDRNYLHKIIEYNKILESRNKLLKQFRDQRMYDEATLETFDIQLSKRGNEIYELRKNFLDEFLPIFRKYYYHFGPETETVNIAYQSQHHQGNILEQLHKHHNIDITSGFTTTGIHKDDLDFTIDARSLKRFGSQGQQKSFILAMKLAYYEYTHQKTSIKPLLLLDDIFDKLDSQRVEKIVQLVSAENFGQIFITDANKIRIENILDKIKSGYKIFSVNLGNIQLIRETN